MSGSSNPELKINDQLSVSMQIDGTPYPIVGSPGRWITLNSNVKQHLPVGKFVLDDITRSFSTSVPVNDGSQIALTINDYTHNSSTQPVIYRAFGTPLRQPSRYVHGVSSYTIYAILDALPYISSSPGMAVTGTSADVLTQAASGANLNLVSDLSPSDSMDWLPGRHRWAGYVQKTVEHAWIDETAVLAHGVDEQRNLYYHNVTQIFKTATPKKYFFHGKPTDTSFSNDDTIPVVQFKAINRSGFLNNIAGYGQRVTQIDATGIPQVKNKVQATTAQNSLDINSQLAQQVSPVSVMRFAAVDCGNCHQNYIAARNQNMRLKATYSQNVYILIGQTSGITLFDLVKFTTSDGDDFSDTSSDGLYTITAITRIVQGNRYYEKLECTSAGPGNQNSSLA